MLNDTVYSEWYSYPTYDSINSIPRILIYKNLLNGVISFMLEKVQNFISKTLKWQISS